MAKIYRSTNPVTGEVVQEFPGLDDEAAAALLDRAHEAYLTWKDTSIEERVTLFDRFADLLSERIDEIARITTLEMGKALAQSVGEAQTVVEMFRYFAEHGPSLLREESVEVPGFSSGVIRKESVGVILGIEPWNGPLYQAMRATSPNLMLGNTVIVKPSEQCPQSTLFFDKLFDEAGFPPNVYQTALISSAQATTFIEDDRVRGVTLTGSDKAGAAVGEQAGRNIKPVVLELGGSDAFVVLDDADIDKAAATAATCRLVLGGQVCASPKRLIVAESVADQFIERFASVFGSQVVGDPFDPNTTVGPLSSVGQADQVQEQLQDAIDRGAKVVVEGGRVEGPGAFFRPAAIEGITEEMRVYTEEVFGPVALIFRVPDDEAAVELANSSRYGLGGTVFSENPERAQAIARKLDTGAVGINAWAGAPIQIPFGGTKRSGVGRELGRTGLDQFANMKTYLTA